MTDLPILELRRIEANIIKPIWREMVAELGEEAATRILRRAIRADAVAQGAAYRAAHGEGGVEGFADTLPNWTRNGALEIEVKAKTPARFDFDVTRCRYAEMYREMGLGKIGHLLSCNRDGAFCEGFDPGLELTRTQTIMQGADHCDFRYRMREGDPDPDPDEDAD